MTPERPPSTWDEIVRQFKRTGRRHKYGAVAVVVDNHRFASKRESRQYLVLKALEKAGTIAGLKLHPRFELVVNGKHICDYIADFEWIENLVPGWKVGTRVVADAKGVRTPAYKIKRALMLAIHGIEVREL